MKPIRLAVAFLLVGAISFAFVEDRNAGAHTYWESNNIRVAGCALSGKYGCQSHYLRRWDSGGYGILYETRHSHVCTDRGGDATWWRPDRLRVVNQATTVYDMTAHNAHQHNSEWCGQSVVFHNWYPNVNSASGWNSWWGYTTAQFPIGPVTMRCGHRISNFSGTSSVDPIGSNVSPAGGNC